MSIHSSISPDECEYSFEGAARPWIDLGYPVIPIVEKRRARKGLVASTDREQIQRWGRAFPQANPGVVLNGLPVVVLDVDGLEGEVALTDLLSQAGCSLPKTYAETTGRDGGRHIYLSLPADSELSVTQYGGTRGWPHKLDWLVNGHVVVAGARHASGRLYSALSPIVPPCELAPIPAELHQLLVERASRRDPAVRVVESPGKAPQQASRGRVPRPDVAAMLEDDSDGRDHRAFIAVSRLVDAGWTEESIVSLVLDSPLGAKARQANPRDPSAWVMHKIKSVQLREPFDRGACWVAAHTSGLGSAHLRVLDFLLGLSGHKSGIVGIGYSKIGLGAAMDQAGPIVRSLVAAGWLVVVQTADIPTGRPTLYSLTVPASSVRDPEPHLLPEGPRREPYSPSPALPPPPDGWSSLWFMTATTGHDAFRRARDTLSATYPLLALLGSQASDLDDLARWLRKPHNAVHKHADALVRAGVAVWGPDGLELTPGELGTALTAVAQRAGTAGTRVRAYRAYLTASADWAASKAAWRAEYDVVGSDVWIAHIYRETLSVFSSPACSGLREDLCERGGRQLEDVAMDSVIAYLERLRRRGPQTRRDQMSATSSTHDMEG